MKKRLIELLDTNCGYCDEQKAETLADYLLANGVVVIDTDVVSPKNRPLITQCFGMPIDEVIERLSADVVPKSEVYGFTAEELAQKCESLSIELEAMRTSANSYKMHYENAKQEVAREIFEKLDSYLWWFPQKGEYVLQEDIYDKLKGEYTESEDTQ